MIGMHIPKAYRAILIATGENITITIKIYRPDPASVSTKFFQKIASIHIPYSNSFIVTDTHKGMIVGTEGNCVDLITMPRQDVKTRKRLYIPDAYCLVIAAAC